MVYRLKKDMFVGGTYRKAGDIVTKIPKGLDSKLFDEVKEEKKEDTSQQPAGVSPDGEDKED
ncbi:MAG: hypothetical protein LBD46_08495 [Endomicrobium sp.]|jgi:hypothetical protein|nr:hypothetical protein [Endomicrobium sp.]